MLLCSSELHRVLKTRKEILEILVAAIGGKVLWESNKNDGRVITGNQYKFSPIRIRKPLLKTPINSCYFFIYLAVFVSHYCIRQYLGRKCYWFFYAVALSMGEPSSQVYWWCICSQPGESNNELNSRCKLVYTSFYQHVWNIKTHRTIRLPIHII